MAVVGIDLGTTNSLVAARNAFGRPEVLLNQEGRPLTPSVIYFGVEPPLVGQEAKEWARLGHDQVASVFKPQMGNPQFRLRFGGRDYTATELSALVLQRLKNDAEDRLEQPVTRAVITVPAYFADAQRRATIEAARLAGLEVLGLLNEPTAAALAYGAQTSGKTETLLIYDLGGGTFDVTVARVTPDEITVLATAGDHDLGGKNWDDRIATELAGRFQAETGIDPLDEPLALNELLVRSEQAKWTLSERSTARVALQIGSRRRSFELTRAEFETISGSLLDRTRRLSEEAMEEAGVRWPDLTGVLLVGGSTRMPMVREYVTRLAGQPPRAGVNVDEVVALGAAIQASRQSGESIGNAVVRFTIGGGPLVRDVMSHSLGVVAVSDDGSRYVNDILIRRNVPIPAENMRAYLHACHGGRNTTLDVYLTQGESSQPRDCTVLGKYVFSGIQPTMDEVMVDVGLSYDANGMVQVRAIQRDTGRPLSMKVEPVPEDLSWLSRPPERLIQRGGGEPVRIFLLIDVSSSMKGAPLLEAKAAAKAFLQRCDFETAEVGLIAFASHVHVLSETTRDWKRLQTAVDRLQAEGTTNLSDALLLVRQRLDARDRTRYVVLLTDGFPDAPENAAWEAALTREEGIQIVAIGTGDADRSYLRRLSSTEEGAIFARHGEVVKTFGHIARVISEGGRSLRLL